MNELSKIFHETLTQWGLDLSSTQLKQFVQYQDMLLAWNQRLNLTAIREPDQVQIRHFLDSLSCSLVTGDLNGRSLIDVGTGAGFPGLPLKILYPDLRLTLVESVAKKCAFLQAVVNELSLKDVTIISERVEWVGRMAQHREQYDWAVARAVAELRVLLEYLLPLCCVGGNALAQKGDSAPEEIAAAQQAIASLGGREVTTRAVHLPHHERQHFLVVVSKGEVTPERYPRRPGIPAKRPL